LQKAAAGDPKLRGHVRLLSVSFDPDRDSSAVLAAHAKTLGADPAVWAFATAPAAIVDRFAAAFGVNVIREKDGTITHNLRTAVIDQSGRVVAVHDDNTWTVQELAGELTRALGH
jgi:protein SCO1/2